MSWFDSVIDSVGDFGSSAWEGASEYLGETWDAVTDVTGDAFAQSLQNIRENGVNTSTLREYEPIKGRTTDGSTIVRPTGRQAPLNGINTAAQMQWINGVDNTVTLAGGVVVTLVLSLLLMKAAK